jgi:hypothetical protein
MDFLVIVILVGLIPAAIAKSKGRSFGLWWLYGSLIFIVALPHALMMRPNIQGLDEQAKLTGFRKCPHCAEFVRPDAIVCKHCGRDIPASPPATETSSSAFDPDNPIVDAPSNLPVGSRPDEIVHFIMSSRMH